MKRVLFLIVCICIGYNVFAINVTNSPTAIEQMDGTKISCFVTGDEFYRYLHDANGYTFVLAEDGDYYYAKMKNGEVVPSSYKVGSVDPIKTALKPWAAINHAGYAQKRAEYGGMQVDEKTLASKASPFTHINNLAVYIKFSDEEEFTEEQIYVFDSVFNAPSESLADYYPTVSFGQLTVKTYSAPKDFSNHISYTDPNPTSYYRPFHAIKNPNGYTEGNRSSREWTLLKSAVEWINANAPIPDSIDLDNDKDGAVDNVSFILRAGKDDWADFIWAHRWSMGPGYNVRIGGKKVNVYIFTPSDQTDKRTVCHEFFHALGAPDLYHYTVGQDLQPAGTWDVMESGMGEMSSHMKERYGKWIEIPKTSSSGYFELRPSTTGKTKIAQRFTINSEESIVTEYRKKTGAYDQYIPGTGLVVYRIDSKFKGNASYDGRFNLDEVYIFRPEGTPTKNGKIGQAHMSQNVDRVKISDNTNPYIFLRSEKASNFEIYDIHEWGDTLISFKAFYGPNFDPEESLAYPLSENAIKVQWSNHEEAESVLVVMSKIAVNKAMPVYRESYTVGQKLAEDVEVVYVGSEKEFTKTNLEKGSPYYFTIYSIDSRTRYSKGVTLSVRTLSETVVCDLYTNVKPGDSICVAMDHNGYNNGYYTGYYRGRSEYAEKYITDGVVGMINSIDIGFSNLYAGMPNSKMTFFIALPNPNGSVGEKIYWQDVLLSSLKVGKNTIKLNTSIGLQKEFYIGYKVYNGSGDTVAVNIAKSDSNKTMTAYTYMGDFEGWVSMEKLKFAPFALDIAYNVCSGVDDKGSYMEVFPKTLTLDGVKDAKKFVGVWSNMGLWTVEDVPDWLKYEIDYVGGFLRFTTISTTNETRIAAIKVKVGDLGQLIEVTQQGLVSLEEDKKAFISVYPNPSASGIFTLKTSENTKYQVIDVTGKVLLEGRTNSSHTLLNISSYGRGVYFVRVQDGARQAVVKLIK